MINCGLFKQRVIIQKRTSTKDNRGNITDAWTNYYSCYAYVNALSGDELIQARAARLKESVNITIRYSPIVSKLDSRDYRIVFNDVVYNIIYIDDYQLRHETLKINAERTDIHE